MLPKAHLTAHQSQMKNMETEFGGDRKVAFILSWQRGEYSRLMPQELCSLHEESRGLYVGKGSQSGVSDEEQKVIGS